MTCTYRGTHSNSSSLFPSPVSLIETSFKIIMSLSPQNEVSRNKVGLAEAKSQTIADKLNASYLL